MQDGDWGTIDTGNRENGTVAILNCTYGYSINGTAAICTIDNKNASNIAWNGETQCNIKPDYCPEIKNGTWGKINTGKRCFKH